MEVYLDAFNVYGDTFEKSIKNVEIILIRCKEANLSLSHEKNFMMFNEGIILGHHISSDGIISIKAMDAALDAPFQEVAKLGVTLAEDIELEKDSSGYIKPKAITNENGDTEAPEINADQGVQMVNNYLEKSNVNPVEELILTLEHQRNYETHVKFIDLAKKMDEGGASLMRTPE